MKYSDPLTKSYTLVLQVDSLAMEEEAIDDVLDQGEPEQRVSFNKWLNLRGSLPKLYNKMR